MDLESAIQHCEDVARQNEEDAILYSNCKKHKKNLFEIGLAENAEKKCCKCAEEHRQLAEWLKELKAYKEPCGDAISRQAVLDAFWKLNVELSPTAIWTIQNMVKDVPPVTPQQRTGQWIEHFDESGKWYECDQCHTDWGGAVNYCPNCGTKM